MNDKKKIVEIEPILSILWAFEIFKTLSHGLVLGQQRDGIVRRSRIPAKTRGRVHIFKHSFLQEQPI